MPFLVKKLAGAPGGRYAVKDSDGKLKDVTLEGVVFDRAPQADPWLEISEVTGAEASRLARLAREKAEAERLRVECEDILARLEAKHGPAPAEDRAGILARLVEDERYREDARAELARVEEPVNPDETVGETDTPADETSSVETPETPTGDTPAVTDPPAEDPASPAAPESPESTSAPAGAPSDPVGDAPPAAEPEKPETEKKGRKRRG